MFNRENPYWVRQTTEERKKIIDNVTRLYVSLLKTDNEITPYEIDVLYSLLISIFRRESISWEVHIRKVIESVTNQDDVISYLNKKLIALDKTRILLSIIVMANSDNNFSISEITQILDLTNKMDLETDGFMNIITAIEYSSQDPVSIKGFRYFNSLNQSIFSDYLLFGSAENCDVRFTNKNLSNQELMVFMIDKYLFVGTNKKTVAKINNKQLNPNELYIFPQHANLTLNATNFNFESLVRIYENRDIYDTIDFKKKDYDFKIINIMNHYSISLASGTVFRNGETIPKNRTIDLFYDDVLQIKSYANFSLLDIIRERTMIGVENMVPKELFINFENDFYTISRSESTNSIAFIEINNGQFSLFPPRRGWDVFINNERVTQETPIHINTDILTINKKNFRINSFYDLIGIPFEVDHINLLDIKHFHPDGHLALDGLSFEIQKGQLIGILGQSGCGKSTLLKTMVAELFPTYGSIVIDGKDFYQNLNYYSQYMGYVPQDDLLFSHLTVFENLYYRGRLRMPKISEEYLSQKINNILFQTNLVHRKNNRVGDLNNKFLSGGERKRLNIALELLFEPTIIICDEPTSGLSYTDTEQIIELLKSISDQGKIVVITIHQPSSQIFGQFDKVLLMDKGGKQVFYGEPDEAYNYFEQELAIISSHSERLLKKKNRKEPDFMYSLIEYPEYSDNGEPIYEQLDQNIVMKRKFPPEYWRDKFKRKMLFDLIQYDYEPKKQKKIITRTRNKMDLHSHLVQLINFFKRNLVMKMRNHANIIITFAEAPLLALIIGFILRLAPNHETYSYYKNINIGIYIFISIIVFIFLGLSNSIEEILSEKKNIIREKMLNYKISYFLFSKLGVLAIFSIVQVALYTVVSSLILGLKGMLLPNMGFLFAASVIGFSLGLCISSFLNDRKAIINILPLVLIPQIIFAGAVIEFEKMNHKIKIVEQNTIPELVQIIPSRWLFEGMYTAQADLNPYDYHLGKIRKNILTLHMNGQNDTSMEMNKQYSQLVKVPIDYPKLKYTNEYINLTVNLMTGRFLNTEKNIFLSSYKTFTGKKINTYIYNMFVILLYTLMLNMITLIRLKYFYKD